MYYIGLDIHKKSISFYPSTQNDAGGTPATSLLGGYHTALHSLHRAVRQALPLLARSPGTSAYSRVPAQLFTVRKLTPGTVTNHLCALRFLYIQTLKRAWSIADTPYPKKRYRLPSVLSQEEVAQLIEAAPTPFYRTILMTLYGTGARRTELTRLKVGDIDSRRMVVHIQDGKGGQDRGVMLSPSCSKNCALNGDACAKSPSGYFPAIHGTAAITPSMTKRPTMPASSPPAAPALRNVSIPTFSAIVSLRTYSKPALTCTNGRRRTIHGRTTPTPFSTAPGRTRRLTPFSALCIYPAVRKSINVTREGSAEMSPNPR